MKKERRVRSCDPTKTIQTRTVPAHVAVAVTTADEDGGFHLEELDYYHWLRHKDQMHAALHGVKQQQQQQQQFVDLAS